MPNIDFNEASLEEAIEVLRSQSGEPPFNIVVYPGPKGDQAAPAPQMPLNLQLRDVPFETALNYIAEFAGFSYRVDSHAIVVSALNQVDSEFSIRVFPMAEAPYGEGESAGRWLIDRGVARPDGWAAYFDPIGKNMIVRNTPSALELVETLMESIRLGEGQAKARPAPEPEVIVAE